MECCGGTPVSYTHLDVYKRQVLKAGGCAFITADHGNAEKMMNPDGTPFTAHTTNAVSYTHLDVYKRQR